MNTVTNILNKHLAAVHNSSPLSIVQRKLINLLLKNAERSIDEDKEHQISIKSLMKGIGWSLNSKTPDNLKECLKELVSIKIEWNIFEQDKKSKWTASTLLASASIKAGDVYYSYSKPLRALLSQPNIYAKLDLDIQKLFKVKYSILLWEFISGELSSKKTNIVTTNWIPYAQMLKLTYLENTAYEKRYSQFVERVINKAVDEINSKSDIELKYEITSERGKIKGFRFLAQKKTAKKALMDLINEDENANSIEKKLESIGIPENIIKEAIKNYTEKQIIMAIDFFVESIKSRQDQIKNPIAFFKKALEEEWVSSGVIQEKLSFEKELKQNNLKKEISNLEEHDECKMIRQGLMGSMGEDTYNSWFRSTRFQLVDDVFYINTDSQFSADWIERHYRLEVLEVIRSYKIDTIKDLKICVEEKGTNTQRKV